MYQTEFEFCAAENEFFESGFFILVADGNTDGNEVLTGRGDFGFKDIIAFQTFAQCFDGIVTIFVKVGFGIFVAGFQFQQEFSTTVQVDTEMQCAGSIFADQRNHVTIVLQFLRLCDDRLEKFCQVDRELLTIGTGNLDFFACGFESGRCVRIFDLVFRHFLTGFCDQFLDQGIFRFVKESFQSIKEVLFLEGEHGRDQYANNNDGEQSAE